jgi:hypothetical protein
MKIKTYKRLKSSNMHPETNKLILLMESTVCNAVAKSVNSHLVLGGRCQQM